MEFYLVNNFNTIILEYLIDLVNNKCKTSSMKEMGRFNGRSRRVRRKRTLVAIQETIFKL